MSVDTNTSVGLVTPCDFLFGTHEADFLELDCGQKISHVNIRYETYGKLDAQRKNAILILHALSGDAHVAGYHADSDKKPGWWDEMVGPGKAFDSNKYYIVCSNVLGGCSGSTGPQSINPRTGKKYNMDFPVITIADMVRAQERLMRHLNIPQWLSVGGGSMGGMQALQWALDYPNKIRSVLAIATAASLSSQGIAFNWVGREAVMSDANWSKGEYNENLPERGLATARMLAHITYLSDESMNQKFGRRLREINEYAYDFTRNFEVESYLDYQGQRFVERFDANSYLYITRAIDYFDLSASASGDLSLALSHVKAPFLVISFSSDWLFPPEDSKEIVRALRSNNIDVVYCDIKSIYGHDAFLLETVTLNSLITDFLACRYEEVLNE